MNSMDRVTGVETAEEEHPRDRPPPPPPPENPGAGLPSRAETHKAAAELDAEDATQPANDKPGTSQKPTDESTAEQDSKPSEVTTESPTSPESVNASGKTLAAERDTPEEQSTAERSDTSADGRGRELSSTSLDGAAPAEPFDPSADQRTSEIEGPPSEDTVVIDDGQPADTVAEAADTRPTAELGGPSDSPSAEASNDVAGQPAAETADLLPEQPESTAPISDAPSSATDIADSTADTEAEDDTTTDRHITDATYGAASQPSAGGSAPETLGGIEANRSPADETDEMAAPADDTAGNFESGETAEEPSLRLSATLDSARKLTSEEIRSLDHEARHEGTFDIDPNETPAETSHKDLQLTVKGIPLNAYLDPVGAAARSYETVEDHDPALERIDEGEPPELSEKTRAEKFRTAFRRQSQDYIEGAGKGTKEIQGLLRGQPPGHVAERAGPDVTPAPHYGPDAANIVTSSLATGAMILELARWSSKHMKKRGERT